MKGRDIIKKKTNKEFLKQLSYINPYITPLEEYINGRTNIKCKCNICGYEWYVKPENLLAGKGCKKCHHERLRKEQTKSHESFKKELQLINPNIVALTKYTKARIKIKCLCKLHNYEFFICPDKLLHGQTGCKECVAIKNHLNGLKTHEQFLYDLKEKNCFDLSILGQYAGARNKIKTRCNKCGYIWFPTAGQLLSGFGCPNCKKSKGEYTVEKFLNENNIPYVLHKTFSNLKGVGGLPLSYDFYLPNMNILIEFQGCQHEHPVDFFGGEDYFKIQEEHDKRKKTYAQKHNIKLLEIWYYDMNNVKNILSNYLIENPVTTTA